MWSGDNGSQSSGIAQIGHRAACSEGPEERRVTHTSQTLLYNLHFSSGHLTFEMSFRHLSGDVKYATSSIRARVQAEDGSLGGLADR